MAIKIPPGGIQTILDANKDKNFVDRIVNKDNYPTLDLGDGNYATHQMAWGESDGKYLVFPTVVYDKNTNTLKKLQDKEAFDYAVKNNEFIEFDNQEDADQFSREYKSVWNMNPQTAEPKQRASADWYDLIEQEFNKSKPKYDQAQADKLRRLSKADAFGRGLMAIGDMISAASAGGVNQRQQSQVQPFVYQGLQNLKADYQNRKDAYANTVAGLRMKKAAMDDANKKWDEQYGIYKGQLDLQQQKQQDLNNYNAARLAFNKAQEEQKKAWQEYLKTKDAKALELAWANYGLRKEQLGLAKMKIMSDPNYSGFLEDDSYYGYDPLEEPQNKPTFQNQSQEIGWMLQWLKGTGLNDYQFQTEGMNMLTNKYGLSVPDAANVIQQFSK